MKHVHRITSYCMAIIHLPTLGREGTSAVKSGISTLGLQSLFLQDLKMSAERFHHFCDQYGAAVDPISRAQPALFILLFYGDSRPRGEELPDQQSSFGQRPLGRPTAPTPRSCKFVLQYAACCVLLSLSCPSRRSLSCLPAAIELKRVL